MSSASSSDAAVHNLTATDDAKPFIRGYLLANDVTARDIQKSDAQWTRGKGFDTFCPVGPVVSNEIDPIAGAPVTLTTRLNGELRQTGSTRTSSSTCPVSFASSRPA